MTFLLTLYSSPNIILNYSQITPLKNTLCSWYYTKDYCKNINEIIGVFISDENEDRLKIDQKKTS